MGPGSRRLGCDDGIGAPEQQRLYRSALHSLPRPMRRCCLRSAWPLSLHSCVSACSSVWGTEKRHCPRRFPRPSIRICSAYFQPLSTPAQSAQPSFPSNAGIGKVLFHAYRRLPNVATPAASYLNNVQIIWCQDLRRSPASPFRYIGHGRHGQAA